MLSKVRMMFDMKTINLIHIFIISIILITIGIKKEKTPKIVFLSLYVLCLAIILLVGFPSLRFSYWPLVQLFHYIVIIPSLIYIAYQQKFSENVCVNFELVHGYNYDEEYVDYWQNWRKFRKKSVYDRKYNLLNHLLRTEKENFINLTLNQMNKILNVFKLLDKTKFNKKRLINMRF